MIRIRKAADRGHAQYDWLDTWHTFSFDTYHDPAHMGFRFLRVMNEDRVQPGQGFGMHGHRDMEIVTYVLEGALEHRDNMGNGSIVHAGEFQRMSAGTGIRHGEFNPSQTEPVHLYQIWLLPATKGLKPSYEQRTFSEEEKQGKLLLVASPDADGALTHAEFLELILQDELAVRGDRQIQRRTKAAAFRELKTLDQFDFSFNPSINRQQLYELATCRFIREAKDVLWLGPPGVGKSFLVQALGYQAIKSGFLVYYRSVFDVVRDFMQDEAFGGQDKVLARYLKPDLLVIDDMGIKQLPPKNGEFLFEIIMRRYELKSTMMTSNRPLEDWGKLIGDVPAASAILDRFLHHAEVINITGKSYRLRGRDRTDLPPCDGKKRRDRPRSDEAETA